MKKTTKVFFSFTVDNFSISEFTITLSFFVHIPHESKLFVHAVQERQKKKRSRHSHNYGNE